MMQAAVIGFENKSIFCVIVVKYDLDMFFKVLNDNVRCV